MQLALEQSQLPLGQLGLSLLQPLLLQSLFSLGLHQVDLQVVKLLQHRHQFQYQLILGSYRLNSHILSPESPPSYHRFPVSSRFAFHETRQECLEGWNERSHPAGR